MSQKFIEVISDNKKKLTSLIPTRRQSYKIADDPSAERPPSINASMSRLTKSPVTSQGIFLNADELYRIESALQSLQDMQSFASWMGSFFFDLVGDLELDPELFAILQKVSSSWSLSMVDQSNTAHSLSAFVIAKRRYQVLSQARRAVLPYQKKELLATDPFSTSLFDNDLVMKTMEEVQMETQMSANLSIASNLSSSQVTLRNMGSRKRGPSSESPTTNI